MKRLLIFMLLAMVMLAACTPAEPDSAETEAEIALADGFETDLAEPTPTAPNPADEPEADSSEEATPVADAATEAEEATEKESETNESVAGFPATNFEEAAVLRERDWFKGAEEPVVEIIEYGDFQ